MSILRTIGTLLRETLLQVPLSLVRFVLVALLLAVLIWVLRLPRVETCPAGDGVDQSQAPWWQNLKVWAAAALLIQVAIYWLI